MTTLNARATTHSIMRSLSQAGWGDLAGNRWQGVRSTLRALVDVLNNKTGEGLSTCPQLADATGLSERWVRRCLNALEEIEIITWTRGGIIDGKPAPSHFRIHKKHLLALAVEAKEILRGKLAERRTKTAERLAKFSRHATVLGKHPSGTRCTPSTPKGGVPHGATPLNPTNKEEVKAPRRLQQQELLAAARESAARESAARKTQGVNFSDSTQRRSFFDQLPALKRFRTLQKGI